MWTSTGSSLTRSVTTTSWSVKVLEAEQLRALLEGTGVEYRKLQFLWNDYAPIYKQMKRLSEARLKDSEFRKLLPTDAFHQNTK